MQSRFRIRPDPPQAGKPTEITYVGPAKEIEWQVDGQAPVRARPDANGKVTITVPVGKALMLTDNLGLIGYLHRAIVDTSKK